MKQLIIIGSGISGLACSYYLRKKFKIKIFEQNDYLGGHTHTHLLENEKIHYDSGFIVFNDKNYSNFIKLINALHVKYQKSNMSFSVTNDKVNYEWAGKNLRTIFDIKNIFTIRYFKILRDIIRFSKLCENSALIHDYSLKEFLYKNNFSKEFINLYLLPMCSSIWSSDLKDIKNYKNWSFWNYLYSNKKLVLTYWMNLLQKLSCKKNIFVTLNYDKIKKEKIIKKISYEHPLFTNPLLTVDKISNAAQGINNIWFSGAWLGDVFHEDGVKSALKVRKLINAK